MNLLSILTLQLGLTRILIFNEYLLFSLSQEQDWLWATEQVMASKGVACCLFWPPKNHLSNKILKRLQLAAKEGPALNFIFRQDSIANQSSPASLRLKLRPSVNLHSTNLYSSNTQNINLDIEILKQQGGWSGQQSSLQLKSL